MLVTEYTMIAKRKTSGWLKCLQQQPLDMYIRNDMLRTNGKLSRIIQFENGLIDQLAKYGR